MMWHHKQTDIIHIKQETYLKLNAGGLLKGTQRKVKLRLAAGKNEEGAFALQISHQEKSDILIRESTFLDMWSENNDALQRWEQEEKGQQNTRVCFEDQFAIQESLTVHTGKDHEQREGAISGEPHKRNSQLL